MTCRSHQRALISRVTCFPAPQCPTTTRRISRLPSLSLSRLSNTLRILRNSSSPMTLSSLAERRCTISTYHHERWSRRCHRFRELFISPHATLHRGALGLGALLLSSAFLTSTKCITTAYTSSTTSTRAILSPQASSSHAFSRCTASYFSSVITTTHRKHRASLA